METIFMNTENSKTNEPHRFVLNLSQRLDLKSLNNYASLQNLLHLEKYKRTLQRWSSEFKLPVGARYSRLYWVHHKKHKTFPTNPPIHIYINRINNRPVWSHEVNCQDKQIIDKTKNGKNVPKLELIEVSLVQCNSVDNQYQQEVLYAFMPNKSCAYMLKVKRNNFKF